ncbi:GNAT family N-acetyltransferase [Micromonospora sp. KC721]|uniref:GNAT family N-acetyltransferase n=1 Tax=Micromonospora sp. KC721 TaxID=2530380 RepID=UPI001FB6F44A|nr:GNAT family N-acetyltransferase [Micromonospora sp. KC721]
MIHEAFRPEYPILTPRLALRPHRADDLDDLLEFHGDSEVVRFLPWPLRDRESTNAALTLKLGQGTLTEPGQWLVLAVESRETKTVIGEVLLKWASAEHKQGELGFVLARAHQGRGYAAEAAAEMLRLGFEDLGLHRITAVCVEDNKSSARLLRRLGFAQEGRLTDNVWFKGGWATQLLFALTEEDWRTPATTSSDQEEIHALIRCYFDAFTSGSRVDEQMAALRDAMLPGAVIVRTCGTEPEVYDVDAFIQPRRAMLTDGTLTDFHEQARLGRLDVFGDIAQWFGRYVKQGRRNGVPYAGGGMKSMQFVRTDAGWRISAAAWDDDCP